MRLGQPCNFQVPMHVHQPFHVQGATGMILPVSEGRREDGDPAIWCAYRS